MISKVQKLKTEQGYTKESACCKNCNSFSSDLVPNGRTWSGIDVFKESNKRCLIGGFAVQSSAYCKEFKRKVGRV